MERDTAAVRLPAVEGVLSYPVPQPASAASGVRSEPEGSSADAEADGVVTDVADARSFEPFYRERRDRIARALAMTLGDVHLGAEAADEAMARAYQRWDRVAGLDDPAAWVYRVGLNWATSVLRRRQRAPRPPLDRDATDVRAPDEPDVLVALGELDVRQRAVVVCRYYLGLNEAETAAALHIRPGTAKSRLHRALRTLQPRLAHLRSEESR